MVFDGSGAFTLQRQCAGVASGEKISHMCSRTHPLACAKWSVYLANMETCGNFIDRFQSAERPLKGRSTEAEQAWTTHETVERKKRRALLVSLRNLGRRYQVWRRKRLTCLHGRRSGSAGTSATLNPSTEMKFENHDAGTARRIQRPQKLKTTC